MRSGRSLEGSRGMSSSIVRQYASIITSRIYFPLWLGQLVSNFGDTLNYIALVVLVYRLSGSGLAVSVTVVFEQVRGRIFTLMDLVWSLMRLISLAVGGALVDVVGIQMIYYLGGALLIGAGLLGLGLLHQYPFKQSQQEEPII